MKNAVRSLLSRSSDVRVWTPLNDVVTCLMDAYTIVDKAENYHDAVMTAIKKGNQTTALASAVGGIAGIKFGYQDIPTGWLNLLRERDND